MQSRIAYICALTVLSWTTALQAQTTYTWDFGSTSGSLAPSSGSSTSFTVSNFSVANPKNGNTSLSSTNSSSGYTGASGAFNYGVSTEPGILLNTTTSTYFAFSVDPVDSTGTIVNAISFGTRINSQNALQSGPRSITIRSSVDNYQSDIITPITTTPFNTWNLNQFALNTTLDSGGAPIEFRIYGYEATRASNGIDFQIDDFSITLTPVPEPGTILGIGAAVMGIGAFVRRKYTKTVSQPEPALTV